MAKPKIDKDEIIRRSQRVLRKTGIAGTSMSAIAKECGLLKGSLYHHFSSKEELVDDVLLNLLEHYTTEIFAVSRIDEPPAEKLRQLIEYSEQVFTLERGGCLMASLGLEVASSDSKTADLIRQFFQDWETCMYEIFVEVGTEEEAKELAENSVATIEGAVLMMQIFQDSSRLKNAHNFIVQQFKMLESSKI